LEELFLRYDPVHKENEMIKGDTQTVRTPDKLHFIFQNKEIMPKLDLRDTEWGGTEWINMADDRDQWWDIVNTAMNLRVL
jgi:hypothetical protein